MGLELSLTLDDLFYETTRLEKERERERESLTPYSDDGWISPDSPMICQCRFFYLFFYLLFAFVFVVSLNVQLCLTIDKEDNTDKLLIEITRLGKTLILIYLTSLNLRLNEYHVMLFPLHSHSHLVFVVCFLVILPHCHHSSLCVFSFLDGLSLVKERNFQRDRDVSWNEARLHVDVQGEQKGRKT